MTKQGFLKVYEDLTEGYTTNLINKDGFEICVSFAYMDNEGEYYFSAVAIKGGEFAHISEILSGDGLEKFVINNGFEVC